MRKHSFSPIADERTKAMFIGTLPGEKSLQFQEYYGNKQNQFWKLLFATFQVEEIQCYADKINWLLNHGYGLWDVIQSGERTGSLDSAIHHIEYNDFEKLHEKYPNIKTLYFTSKNAYQLYFKKYKHTLPFQLEVLPSPSGAYARISFQEKLIIWKEVLLK